jgi:hypothetical protein
VALAAEGVARAEDVADLAAEELLFDDELLLRREARAIDQIEHRAEVLEARAEARAEVLGVVVGVRLHQREEPRTERLAQRPEEIGPQRLVVQRVHRVVDRVGRVHDRHVARGGGEVGEVGAVEPLEEALFRVHAEGEGQVGEPIEERARRGEVPHVGVDREHGEIAELAGGLRESLDHALHLEPAADADLHERRALVLRELVHEVLVRDVVRLGDLGVPLGHRVEELDLRDVEALEVDVLRLHQAVVHAAQHGVRDDVRDELVAGERRPDGGLEPALDRGLREALAAQIEVRAGIAESFIDRLVNHRDPA